MKSSSDRRKSSNTVQKKMYRLMLQMFIPIAVILVSIFVMLLTRNLMYASVSGNIVKVSGFNQKFKQEIDEQMYFYVTGYSDEMPWEDVESARSLAEDLLQNTSNSDGRKSITSVLSLCDKLSIYMQDIENTSSYDDRMNQLETNIYITTGLIEEYMYSYLYYEAGEMASIQKQIDFWLTVEILFVVLAYTGNDYLTFAALGLESVIDRILDERLQSHLRKFCIFDRRIYIDLIFHDIPVTDLLDLEITLDMLFFFGNGYDVAAVTEERTEVGRQARYHLFCLVVLAYLDEPYDSIECVVEEVRIDLCLDQ